MIAKDVAFVISGLDGIPVDVEAEVNQGLFAFEIVGLPDAAVKESRERVRSAIKNSGKKFPNHRITVNLAPAEIKKEGSMPSSSVTVAQVTVRSPSSFSFISASSRSDAERFP